MELRHLRYFVAVAETENVSRAALKLHISQPALSRQIRDLEGELGFLLLERTAKSVRLTEAGRVFLTESRAVLERVAAAVSTARSVATGKRRDLHIGYAPTLAARLLPQAVRAFKAAMPGVRVKLHDLSTGEMLAGLRDGRLQVAILERQRASMLRGLRFEEFLRDPLRLAVAHHHPLARRRTVTLADALREPFIAYNADDFPDYHALLTRVFPTPKGRLRIAEETDGASSLISAVGAGNGVALVAESLACIAGAQLKILPITPAPKPLSIGIVSPQTKQTPAVKCFLKYARDVILKNHKRPSR